MAPKKMTDAEKAKLKKMLMQGGKINLDKAAKERAFERARAADKKAKAKPSTSYSPAPMSAAAKAKAAAAGKATAAKTAKPSTAAQIAKRFGITAREARDIATALGTVGKAVKENTKFYGGDAVKNLKNQIAETARAAATGKRGTESDQIVSNKRIKGSSAQFTGQSRDKAKNKPGRSVTDATKWYNK